MEKIVIKCPECARPNAVGREHIGKHARCGACETVFVVADRTSNEAVANVSTYAPRQLSSTVARDSAQTANATDLNGTQGLQKYPVEQAIQSPNPFADQNAQLLPPQNSMANAYAGTACSACNTNAGSYERSQTSTAGWIVFAILLITFWPLFWIGLMIKDTTHHCRHCHHRIG